MADFPNISVKNNKTSDKVLFSQVRGKPQNRFVFENQCVQSNAKVSTSRYKFRVGGVLLTTTQLNTLVDFFDDNQGGTFNFTHPITGTIYVVRFSDDELPEAVPVGDGSNARWKIEGINLEETTGSIILVVQTTTTTTTTSSSTTSSTSSTASTISTTSSTISTTSSSSSTSSTQSSTSTTSTTN